MTVEQVYEGLSMGGVAAMELYSRQCIFPLYGKKVGFPVAPLIRTAASESCTKHNVPCYGSAYV